MKAPVLAPLHSGCAPQCRRVAVRLYGLILFVALVLGPAVHAQQSAPPSQDRVPGGAEPVAAESERDSWLTPAAVYDGAAFANVQGGARRGATYVGNLNLRLFANLGKPTGLGDLLAYGNLLWIHGGDPSARVGDAQRVSNLSAPAEVEVYEAWLQKNSEDGRLSLLGGLYDLNSEFDRLQAASLFINSSFGISAAFASSGSSGPSIFPHTSIGLRGAWKPLESLVIRGAVLNGAPYEHADGSRSLHRSGDGALFVGEVAYLARPSRPGKPTDERLRIGRHAENPRYDDKVAIGVWHYTASFDDLSSLNADGSPVRCNGSSGAYLVAEGNLFASEVAPIKRLTGFVQAGVGDQRTTRFGSYLGAGITLTGLLRAAGDDELGLAIATARNASHYTDSQALQNQPVAPSERSIELSYLVPVDDHLAIQPDLQYVIRPNSDPRLKNALALQLRFEVSY